MNNSVAEGNPGITSFNSSGAYLENYKLNRNSTFEIYFQKSNIGIFKIENGEGLLVSDEKEVKNQEIVGAFLIDKKTKEHCQRHY